MRLLKWVAVILVLVFPLIIGAWAVHIAYFTHVYPPIKEYNFKGSENELIENLNSLKTNYQVLITDTTGQYPDDYNIYFDIIEADSCAYHLKYSIDGEVQIKISLIGVFDLLNSIGGYSNSEEEIILILKNKFERELIEKITITTNISINTFKRNLLAKPSPFRKKNISHYV